MAKSKYDWAPFFEAYKALPEEKQLFHDLFRDYGETIEEHCRKKEEESKLTPLHFAAECGLLDVCRHYLDQGVDVDVKTRWAETPLFEAAYKGHIAVCRLLLERGADPLVATKHQGLTPFHKAARRGDEMCRLFLDLNLDVNIASNQPMFKGETPFLNAAGGASVDTLKIFLDRGGDIHHLDWNGDSALHKAAAGKSVDNCKLLLERGADLLVTGKKGETVLHRAVDYCWQVTREKLEPIIRFLILDCKIPVDIRDKQDNTPLHATAEQRGASAAELLLELGADPNARNKKKDTVLHLAARNGSGPEYFQAILKGGADPRMKDAKGQTPLDILLPQVEQFETHLANEKSDDSRARTKEHLTRLKASAALLEKALKEWEGKPETVAKKGGKAEESKPTSKKKSAGIVPLKKPVTLPTILNLNRKPDLSHNAKLNEVHESCGVILPDYDEFVTKYGKGIVSYVVRVTCPDQVMAELKETRERWSEYFLWDDEDSKLDQDDLVRSTSLADTIQGDEFIYYPGSDEDKPKKPGIYILPRNEYSIHYVGKDIGDIFKYTRKLFRDYPKDVFCFEGYNEIMYQEYTIDKMPKPFDELAKALRNTGKYDHEIMQKGKYLTLCSTALGGLVDLDYAEKKVFIRCNKNSDTGKVHNVLTGLGFKHGVKDKMLYTN